MGRRLQSREAPPDLENDLLIQVFPVGDVPGIDPADLQYSGPILLNQFQKLFFVR